MLVFCYDFIRALLNPLVTSFCVFSLNQIQDIIRMSHLLTVFGVCEDNQGDVDVAILQALLKGGGLTCVCKWTKLQFTALQPDFHLL